MDYTAIFILIFTHWVADFVIQQSEWQTTKSHNFKNLLKHTLTYSIVIWWVMEILVSCEILHTTSLWTPLLFAAVQFVTHTVIDYVTSRINSRLWKAGRTHDFFVSIGFDQVLHYGI